jgi:hypothetical protein
MDRFDHLFGYVDDVETAQDVLGRTEHIGGNSLDQRVALRDRKRVELIQQAPFARISPQSILRGSLGNQVTMTPGDPPKQVAFWPGDDADCLPVTATLGPVLATQVLPTKAQGAPIRPYGILQWGTRGAQVSAEVDIGTGAQLTLGAANITLQVALEDTTSLGVTVPVQLTGMLSFYPIVSAIPNTRTRYINSLIVSQTITIPAFAKSFTIWRDTRASQVTALVQSNASSDYTYTLAANTDMTTPIPLAGDSSKILITNGGAPGLNVVVIFQLGL